MHLDDKLGKVAIADLCRSKNKVIVNPFPEGQAIVAIAHNTATHFHYGKRTSELHKFARMVPGGCAEIKLQNDRCCCCCCSCCCFASKKNTRGYSPTNLIT